MLYTLRIEKAGAAVLDGTTLLDLNATGVTVDRTVSGEIVVTVPDGVGLGRIDPGQVLEELSDSGRTFIVEQISVVSDGGAYPGPGTNIVERTTPTAGAFENIETIQDLATNAGLPGSGRRLFMHDHALAITTTVAGPHVVSLLLKSAEDSDLEGPRVDGPNGVGDTLYFSNDQIAASTTTRFMSPGNRNNAGTPEIGILLSRPGILHSLRLVQIGAGNGNDVVFTANLDGTATALTMTVASTAAAGNDLVNNVVALAGQIVSVEVVKAASIGVSPDNVQVSMEFSPS